MTMDVIYALKREGKTLYGFGGLVLVDVSWCFWIRVSCYLVLVVA